MLTLRKLGLCTAVLVALAGAASAADFQEQANVVVPSGPADYVNMLAALVGVQHNSLEVFQTTGSPLLGLSGLLKEIQAQLAYALTVSQPPGFQQLSAFVQVFNNAFLSQLRLISPQLAAEITLGQATWFSNSPRSFTRSRTAVSVGPTLINYNPCLFNIAPVGVQVTGSLVAVTPLLIQVSPRGINLNPQLIQIQPLLINLTPTGTAFTPNGIGISPQLVRFSPSVTYTESTGKTKFAPGTGPSLPGVTIKGVAVKG